MADDKNDLYIGVKSDLSPFNVDLNALTRGLVVIGQSGCGKSFLVGRLIEEIIRVTTDKTRVLIIDPNSDFYYGSILKGDDDFEKVLKRYYTEQLNKQYVDFNALEITNYAELKSKLTNAQIFGKTEDFNLSWKYIINSTYRFRKIIKAGITSLKYRVAYNMLVSHLNEKNKKDLDDYGDASRTLYACLFMKYKENEYFTKSVNEMNKKILSQEGVLELLKDVSDCEYSGLWRKKEDEIGLPERLFHDGLFNIVNLEDNKYKFVILSYLLLHCFESHRYLIESYRKAKESGDREKIEEAERKVKHTFILIDEVHNFAPEGANDPHEKMLGELIHTIAAEGRKYGLHLILATQRPNKIKRGLLGECDNAIIMKMNSRSDLDHLAQEMRILDVKLLEPCLHFQGQGNALAVGEMTRMAPYVQLFKSAPRRTLEGGVDILGF